MKYDIKKLKKTKDLPKLIKLLSYKKDAAIRANAAAALGNLRDKRGIEPLIGALEDKDWDCSEKLLKGSRRVRRGGIKSPSQGSLPL